LTAVATTLALLGVTCSVAAASPVRSSHSGWFWGQPVPQAQNLSAVEFSNAVGYASGDFGTLIRSGDFGRSWDGIQTGLTEPLTHLQLLGSKTVIVGGTCALRRSDDGGVTFRRLPWTASDESCSGGIADFDFASGSIGYLTLGNGNVLRSGDAGRTWSRRTAIPDTAASGVPNISPVDIDFVSDTTGYAATNGGEAFQTTDGGNTWRTVLGLPFTLRSIAFPTPEIGYVAGDAPAVFKTVDGGQSWFESDLPGDIGALAQIRCASPTVCEGVGWYGDRLVRTTDGGGTWDSVAPATLPIRSVALPTADRIVAVGQSGTTVTAAGAGSPFTPVGGALPGRFTGVSAINASDAYAYGLGGSLARTKNGGLTWTETDAATSDNVKDVSFLNPQRGYILDTAGQLLRTTNGGGSYEILDTGTAERPLAVQVVDKRHVLLVGPAGVWRSTDGRTFRANAQAKLRKAPLYDADRYSKNVVVYGPKHIFLSRNGGAGFRQLARPNKHVRVEMLDIVSSKTIFLLDARGYLWRTDDSAGHWHELAGLGTEIAYGMSFSDSHHGWVAVPEFGSANGGWLMRTNDGGKTWQPQLLVRSAITRFGVGAAGKNAGFAVTGSNGVFATRAGGSAGKVSTLVINSPARKIPQTKNNSGVSIRIHGRLKKARGGERIVVSYREAGSPDWVFQEVAAASSGTFTVVAHVRYATTIVAQWAGNDRARGAGSSALKIPGPSPKK
jgi:photosystem II stability/assembly factor-like uncharacterized protein